MCNMQSWHNNIRKIRNVMFIFQNKKKSKCKKTIEKIQMDSKKSINSFEMQKEEARIFTTKRFISSEF